MSENSGFNPSLSPNTTNKKEYSKTLNMCIKLNSKCVIHFREYAASIDYEYLDY